jgi:hypothetical protein
LITIWSAGTAGLFWMAPSVSGRGQPEKRFGYVRFVVNMGFFVRNDDAW